ncbi:MAG: hypothetical protein IKJ17_01920 [Clostridia bacterium]|nr:hypothetical protein [Clostridia bacterium]
MHTVLFGLYGAGAGFLFIDLIIRNGLLTMPLDPFPATKWCFIIGLCIGAIIDVTSYSNEKAINDKKEQLKLQSNPMRNTEVYKRLIAYDRQNILKHITYVVEKELTLYNNPRINISSTIPYQKSQLNKLLSDWGFKDLSDDQFALLKLAIAFTNGYQLIQYDDFGVDKEYWQKYIDDEISRRRKFLTLAYEKDQAGKKDLYGNIRKTATTPVSRPVVSPKRPSIVTNRTAITSNNSTKQTYSNPPSASVNMAVRTFENAYNIISKNKSVFGFTTITAIDESNTFKISFVKISGTISDSILSSLRSSGFNIKCTNGTYLFSAEIPFSSDLMKSTMTILKKKHPDWNFTGSGVLVN